ncbi:MAG: alpha/beta hydrolase family protein [Acidobacteriota bacterium]
MKKLSPVLSSFLVLISGSLSLAAQEIGPEDIRLSASRTQRYEFKVPEEWKDREAWNSRAAWVRRHLLVSAGLWPLPERTPLRPVITGRVERAGYSVEKVRLESFPGFYVFGNLYRPSGSGPFPGVLSAHGHWAEGRFENTGLASVPGRAINLALQGYVVFSYSMLGFNEGRLQIEHEIQGTREELWGISSLGLQLWNSMRALDFLAGLPDVDPKRIGMTGGSGGATQTIFLAAVDDRVQVTAPVNALALQFQGSCSCENAPNLRIEVSNLELAGLTAPRPMLIVSTAGDWTRDTPAVEYPALRRLYGLFGPDRRVGNAHFNYPHNFNQDSREAVYDWFARWLQPGRTLATREAPFQVEERKDLVVCTQLPAGAVNRQQLTDYLVGQAKQAVRACLPRDEGELRHYRDVFGSAYRDALAASLPSPERIVSWRAEVTDSATRVYLGRRGAGDRVPAVILSPPGGSLKATLVADPEGWGADLDENLKPRPGSLVGRLLGEGRVVLLLRPFPAGERINPRRFTDYPSTYNQAPMAHAAQDVLTGIGYLRGVLRQERISLIGRKQGGLAVLLAAGLAGEIESAAADMDRFDNRQDDEFVRKLNIPLLRRVGDLTTAVALTAPTPLVLFNCAPGMEAQAFLQCYRAAGAEDRLTIEFGPR